MTRLVLVAAAAITMAAAPQGGFSIVAPGPTFTVTPEPLDKNQPVSRFAPAPLPNRDAATPTSRESTDASLSPGLFTRRDQYHGEALSASSSVQSQQERRAKPGAGLNLTMPLQ